MNYTEHGRSNYVRLNERGRKLIHAFYGSTQEDDQGRVAIFNDDDGGMPRLMIHEMEAEEAGAREFLWEVLGREGPCPAEDTEEWEEVLSEIEDNHIRIADVIHHLLEPGEVWVWVESGHEGLRYIGGYAVAIDSTGKCLREISLDSIYDGLPEGVTRAML